MSRKPVVPHKSDARRVSDSKKERDKRGLDRSESPVIGKRVQFDPETWHAIDLLARDTMTDFQELADEAFRDLLQKHGRPTDLKTALRRSAGASAPVVPLRKKQPLNKRNRVPPD